MILKGQMKHAARMNRMEVWPCLACLSLCCFFTGCAQTFAPIHLNLTAAAHINPDNIQRPLSVVTRFYQLKDKTAFERLTLTDFTSGQSDEILLGQDMVSRQEHVLIPGQHCPIDLTRHEQAHYLGIVAFYRQPDPGHWRVLYRISDLQNQQILTAERCGLVTSGFATVPLYGQDMLRPLQCSGS